MACYTMLISLLLILIVGSSTSDAFFVNSNISFVGERNITCAIMVDYYALLPDQRNITGGFGLLNMTLTSSNDFCIFQKNTIKLRNGTEVNTSVASIINSAHYYQNFVSRRCSSGQFWPLITPIGYGACTRLPYETYTTTLCICSTNNCNVDYSTCVASVQANQGSPPPNLPTVFPDLTNLISCRQGYQGVTYSYAYNGEGWLYNEYTPLNMSEARVYEATHAVACLLYVNTQTGDWFQGAVPYESYTSILYSILTYKNVNLLSMYVESSTSVSAQRQSMYYTNSSSYWNSNMFTESFCLCTTNNCNQNLSSCALGLNANVSSTIGTTPPPTSSTFQTTTSVSRSINSTTTVVTTSSTVRNMSSPVGTSTTSTNSPALKPSQCFSGTSLVRRDDGVVIMLRDVHVGDRLLVSANKYSPVLTFFVHQPQGPSVDYLRVSTTVSTLEITPSHLILMRRRGQTSPPQYLQAVRLRSGDSIFFVPSNTNETTKEIEVIRVESDVQRNSAFAPLTEAGTLVIDDVLVSCYAKYESHSLIHVAMTPYRVWQKIKSQMFNSNQDKELHPYIQFWLHASQYLHLLIHSL